MTNGLYEEENANWKPANRAFLEKSSLALILLAMKQTTTTWTTPTNKIHSQNISLYIYMYIYICGYVRALSLCFK